MKTNSTRSAAAAATALVTEAWEAVGASFERFCLTAGIATLAKMMEEDATQLCWWPLPAVGGQGRTSLGQDQGQDRLPRWQDRGRPAPRA